MEWAREARVNKSNNSLMRFVALFAICCAAASSNAAETVVIGPVEKIANRGNTFTVLGQTFRSASAPSVGSYALVIAERARDGGLVAKSVRLLDTAYVPGASQIYLRATVDRYSASTGLVQIGGLKVLISEALAAVPAPSIVVGQSIELVGMQAAGGGPVWATDVAVPQVDSTIDEDLTSRAIQGTGTFAIQGTGSLAIQGTGKRAIQGTGALAIQGTGTQAIQGTGKRAIQGTGALAIQGTGTQAIQGTGKRAIQGTGALAIQGTGTQAIQGPLGHSGNRQAGNSRNRRARHPGDWHQGHSRNRLIGHSGNRQAGNSGNRRARHPGDWHPGHSRNRLIGHSGNRQAGHSGNRRARYPGDWHQGASHSRNRHTGHSGDRRPSNSRHWQAGYTRHGKN